MGSASLLCAVLAVVALSLSGCIKTDAPKCKQPCVTFDQKNGKVNKESPLVCMKDTTDTGGETSCQTGWAKDKCDEAETLCEQVSTVEAAKPGQDNKKTTVGPS